MSDVLTRATAAQGGIRLVAVLTTETTKEAAKRHSLSFLTSALIGRAMSAGLLLASSMKTSQGRVTIKIQSDGPIGGLMVDAGRDGSVRGYVGNPNLELDLIKTGNNKHYFDFGTATGTGYLHITRDNGDGEPYTSTVELSSGAIGEDIASYLLHSEQTLSAVFVGEKIENNNIVCSGGLLAQIMPKDDQNLDLINLLNNKCNQASNFTENLFKNSNNLQNLFKELFEDLNPQVLNIKKPYEDVFFKCRCSRNRSISALKLLGKQEIEDMIKKDKGAELICSFCKETYFFNEKELTELI